MPRSLSMPTSVPKDLVYPDRIPPAGLVSWTRVSAQLGELAEDRLLSFSQAFLPAAQNHPHAGVRAAVNRAITEDPGSVLPMAMLGALSGRHIKAYVLSSGETYAYEVVHEVWSGAFVEVANPVTMALTYRFIITGGLRPRCALDLAGSDNILAFREADVDQLVKLRGSQASLLREAKIIMDEYGDEHPNQVMRKADFYGRIRKHFPRASNAALGRARITARPELKHYKGGRPPKG